MRKFREAKQEPPSELSMTTKRVFKRKLADLMKALDDVSEIVEHVHPSVGTYITKFYNM